ncbi:MFS transporter, partial [candidate division GN15 bacterium]|nr:MFS transporter [candidate division GN15 bacterium]
MSEPIHQQKMVNGPRSLIRIYDTLTGDEDARVCTDIPEDACREQPGNFFKHLSSSFFTKLGDSLASAKLILPWLMATLGAPAYLVGFLVPIRESGALLPQLLVAGFIRPKPVRKWFWVAASVVEGLAVIGMAFVAIGAEGAMAGWAIVALLAVFSLSRGVASVTSKDVLGKTISKRRRGTLMGYASAVAGVVTILVGAYLKGFRGEDQPESFFFLVLLGAGLLWFLAAAIFAFVKET